MKTFISKSLSPEYTDEQVKDLCGSTSFISFWNVVMEQKKAAIDRGQPSNIKGYRVNERGIEIIWEL